MSIEELDFDLLCYTNIFYHLKGTFHQAENEVDFSTVVKCQTCAAARILLQTLPYKSQQQYFVVLTFNPLLLESNLSYDSSYRKPLVTQFGSSFYFHS